MNDKAGTAVILIGHGSRVPGAGRDMEKVAMRLESSGAYGMVAACYMSRVRPFFPETLENVVRRNARKVIVIPYFLHSGLHLVLDIPMMIQEEAKKYPGVNIIYGEHLGYDDAMVELVGRRIDESEKLKDVRELSLGERDQYPLAEGEKEFVPMTPEEAREYMKKHGHGHHHHHH